MKSKIENKQNSSLFSICVFVCRYTDDICFCVCVCVACFVVFLLLWFDLSAHFGIVEQCLIKLGYGKEKT